MQAGDYGYDDVIGMTSRNHLGTPLTSSTNCDIVERATTGLYGQSAFVVGPPSSALQLENPPSVSDGYAWTDVGHREHRRRLRYQFLYIVNPLNGRDVNLLHFAIQV